MYEQETMLELEPVTIMSSTYISTSKIPYDDLKTNKEESVLLQMKPRPRRKTESRSNQACGACFSPHKARFRCET